MMARFEKTVRAITEAVLWARMGPEGVALVGPVSGFVLAQCARMPDYLRLPLFALTLLCDSWPLFLGFLRPLHHLPLDERWRVISAWKRSRLSSRRSLIRFYESLTVYGSVAETQEGSDG